MGFHSLDWINPPGRPNQARKSLCELVCLKKCLLACIRREGYYPPPINVPLIAPILARPAPLPAPARVAHPASLPAPAPIVVDLTLSPPRPAPIIYI
jgi:hypothetical protein